MRNTFNFDYYYGIEAEQYSFYRVPRLLIKDERFKGLSSDAKLLYGLMLDRMSLSLKNGWLDDENRAYIIYTIESIMEDLGCAKATCVKIMKELDSENGIGLIEKKRRGLGKPDIIYVKNFASISEEEEPESPSKADESTEVQNLNLKKFKTYTSRSLNIEPQEVQNLNFKKFDNCTSESSETEPTEVQKLAPNYININNTDISYNNHINHSENESHTNEVIDRMAEINAYADFIKENIEYAHHMEHDSYPDKEIYEELFQLICDVVFAKCSTMKIGKVDYPHEIVKARFLKLNGTHLEYVIDSMGRTNSSITDIKSYMITALFNAPTTMKHYYQQAVQHDLYGG